MINTDHFNLGPAGSPFAMPWRAVCSPGEYDPHGRWTALCEVGTVAVVCDTTHGECIDAGHIAVTTTVIVNHATVPCGPYKERPFSLATLEIVVLGLVEVFGCSSPKSIEKVV